MNYIDTAMFLVHKKHIIDIKWDANLYQADAVFICDILKQNPQSHKFLNVFACYHNFIE